MKIINTSTTTVVLSFFIKRRLREKKIKNLKAYKVSLIVFLLFILPFNCFSSSTISKINLLNEGKYVLKTKDTLGIPKTTTSVEIDTDGDGVLDVYDLDDDNDGILDKDEGFEDLFALRNEGLIITINGSWILVPTSVYVDLPATLAHGDEFWVPFFGGTYVKAVKIRFENTEKGIRFTQTAAKHTVGNDPELDISLDYDFDNGGLISPIALSDTDEGYGVSSIEYKDKIIIPTYIGGVNGQEWTVPELDTDNDGLIDSRDTDSDNDGCPDVTEGSNRLIATATLADGSNGGSFGNLGVLSNKNGIPLPLGTVNGEENIGQSNSDASIYSEHITVSPLSNISATAGDNISIPITASGVQTVTFNLGVPNYTDIYGIDSSDQITYKWYKDSNPNNVISTSKNLFINSANYTNVGTYTVEIFGGSNTCVVTQSVEISLASTEAYYYPTSPAKCFNIFTENNFSATSGSANGSIATGGDLLIKGNYILGSQNFNCFTLEDIDIGLIVNGKVNYFSNAVLSMTNESQYIKIGESDGSVVWYKDSSNEVSPIKITSDTNYNSTSNIQLSGDINSLNVSAKNNPVFEKNVLDFALAFQALKTNSLSLSQINNNAHLTDNDTISIGNTNLPNLVTIDLQNGTNYLNINGSDLNNVSTISFKEQPSEHKVLVINVDAAGIFDWSVWEQNTVGLTESSYVLYNFFNTTELNIVGNEAVFGSILAPFANISKTINKNNISGQVIGKSFNHDGGEIQYTKFNSPAFSFVTSGIAPLAEFSVNNNECLENNLFLFDNQSSTGSVIQPKDPITYSWDFGDATSSTEKNPNKTYSESGVYDVVLTASNTYGSDVKTTAITVLVAPNKPVISDETISSTTSIVTKEFTLENNTYFDSFSWELEGEGSGLFPNQKTVTFDFETASSYQLTVTGIKNGCSQTETISVIIASDEVTTGNKGGIESESLGDAISKIYINRKRNSEPVELIKSDETVFNKVKKEKELLYQSKSQTMTSMFPTELIAGDVANETSPTDILDYTMADEVLSVDFSVDGKTKGVVLGIRTTDKIYNHTKASCDRLKGAEILNIKTVALEGYNFLIQGIKQKNNIVEYVISFVAAKNASDQSYTLQTNWNVSEYTYFNEVYNFQVWSTNYDDTKKLVGDILSNLKAYIPVNQNEVQKIPKAFAAKITRDKSDLIIKLKSNEKGLNTEVFIEETSSETTENSNQIYNPTNDALEQVLRIDINDGYEYNGLVTIDNVLQDNFYHADGNWGLDYDSQNMQVNEFVVSNNFDREYEDEELEFNRNVKINATGESDDLIIYKSLLPGNLSADYSEYKYLSFKAKGNGLIELGLIKSSIIEWKEQYKLMVDLLDEEQVYYVPFDYFTSTGSTDKMTAEDLTTITFTFLPVEANNTELDLTISDVKFVKTATQDQILGGIESFEKLENRFIAYPNPTKGNINLVLFSHATSDAIISLYDITGKEIYSKPAKLTVGKNEITFNPKVKPGILFLKVRTKQINYGTTKMIFK